VALICDTWLKLPCFQGILAILSSPLVATIAAIYFGSDASKEKSKRLANVIGEVSGTHRRLSIVEKVDELLHGERHLQYSRAMFVIMECRRKYSEEEMTNYFTRSYGEGNVNYSPEFLSDMTDFNSARTTCNV
jgi:hypothetical protein